MEISVKKPTILTGANDGGKSAALAALGFLLTGKPLLTDGDRTNLLRGEMTESLDEPDSAIHKVTESVVVGRFTLSSEEQAEHQLPSEVQIRRVSNSGEAVRLELLRVVPRDVDLRGLDAAKLDELKRRVKAREIDSAGKKSARDTWLAPLRELASAALEDGDTEDEWVSVSSGISKAMPLFLLFASNSEPDPEQEIKNVLREVLRASLEEEADTVQVLRDLEGTLQSKLERSADNLCDLIGKRCPDLDAVTVRPVVSFVEGISDLQVCHLDAHGREIPLKQMGTGRRRQVSLAVWEWTRDILRQGVDAFDSPIVIAYDEPDTHLDYGHQRKLMDLLHEQCSNPRVRMIVATHSLNLIDRVDIQDVIHFRLDGDRRTVIERLLSTDHQRTNEYLARISSAVGLSNSVLLHERCFVGVEGPTELECLPVLFRLALGVPMQSVGIALVNGGNNVGALQLVKYLNSAGRRVAFILDRDCISVQGERRTFDPRKLKANGFIDDQINYIGTKELEDLFSDEQWAVAANQAWPRDDGEEWKSEHIADLRSGRKFSDLLLQVVRTNSSEAPANKQSLVVELACRLISPDDVPVNSSRHSTS